MCLNNSPTIIKTVTVQIPELLLAKAHLKSAPQMGLLLDPAVFSYGLCSKCTDLPELLLKTSDHIIFSLR